MKEEGNGMRKRSRAGLSVVLFLPFLVFVLLTPFLDAKAGGKPLLTLQDPQLFRMGIIAFRAVGEGGTEIDDLELPFGSPSGGPESQTESLETARMAVPGNPQGGQAVVPSKPAQ